MELGLGNEIMWLVEKLQFQQCLLAQVTLRKLNRGYRFMEIF